jgi:RNA polymerase sigma-70 factor (ECF subfamily)
MAREPDTRRAQQLASLFDGNEPRLVQALRERDEAAFVALMRRYHGLMLRIAAAQLTDRAAAEEVVQETWLAVIKGIDSFEERSSLRTWIFRILTYQAFARVKRDGRVIPFSGLVAADAAAAGPTVDSSQFLARDDPVNPYRWAEDPKDWPERALLAAEARAVIATAIETLPDSQRVVVSLRDLEGWTSAEVCEALDISDGNQRVLLHRARSTVRATLDRYVNGTGQ